MVHVLRLMAKKYRVCGFEAPGISVSPDDWINRFTTAHNSFIVVSGLIFTSTFSAVSSMDPVAGQ